VIGKAWDLLVGWLKETRAWPKIQVVLVILSALVAAEVLALRFISWEYDVSPRLSLFLRSTISVRILLVFAGLALLGILFSAGRTAEPGSRTGRLRKWYLAHRKIVLFRAAATMVVLAAVAAGFYVSSPLKLSNIRIVFLEPPREVNREAFAYLVYEINLRQRHVYFEVDFEPFNVGALKSEAQQRCEGEQDRYLCYTEEYSREYLKGGPAIGITRHSLGDSFFGQHRGSVSVITTFDRDAYEPISTYEYLAFSVVVQSIVIQLDAHGQLPEEVFQPSQTSHGGVFQYSPRKQAIKSVISAARLSPREEELLFNRFGPAYARSCAELLSLDWYRSEEVQSNLRNVFGIDQAVTP
jgi:hypothetical protein